MKNFCSVLVLLLALLPAVSHAQQGRRFLQNPEDALNTLRKNLPKLFAMQDPEASKVLARAYGFSFDHMASVPRQNASRLKSGVKVGDSLDSVLAAKKAQRVKGLWIKKEYQGVVYRALYLFPGWSDSGGLFINFGSDERVHSIAQNLKKGVEIISRQDSVLLAPQGAVQAPSQERQEQVGHRKLTTREEFDQIVGQRPDLKTGLIPLPEPPKPIGK